MKPTTERELEIVMDAGAELAARKSALEKIGAMGDTEAVKPLAVLLTEIEHELVPLVKQALKKLGATGLLSKHAAEGSVEERAHAVQLLGYLEDQDALPVFLRALEDGAPRVRTFAADGLIRLRSEEGVGALADRLHGDPDPEVRMAAAQALGRIATDEAIAALEHSLATETDGFVLVLVELAHGRAVRTQSDRAFWS